MKKERKISSVLVGFFFGWAVAVAFLLGILFTAQQTHLFGLLDNVTSGTEIISKGPVLEASKNPLNIGQIYSRSKRGIVSVTAIGVETEGILGVPGEEGAVRGTGFVVDKDGHVITNYHVVAGASDITVQFGPTQVVEGKLLGSDPSNDLALIKVDPNSADVYPLPLGNSSNLAVGDPVVAIGDPLGYNQSVTSGIVSALKREIPSPTGYSIEEVIQTDASINHGNSGGPLLDNHGRVVGINSQIATDGQTSGSIGIGFAIPINTAKELLPRLERGEVIERTRIGITMEQMNTYLAEETGSPITRGVLIQEVVPGSPADQAGLQGGTKENELYQLLGGDLITRVNKRVIKGPADIVKVLADRSPGDVIKITYYRGDEKHLTKVTLIPRSNKTSF